MEVTVGKVSEKQEGFWKGKVCVDQIFVFKIMEEEYLGKDDQLCAAFIYLKKKHVIVDMEALWNIPKIYGVGGQLLGGIKAFYREISVCVYRELSKFSYRSESETRMCDVAMAV